MGKNRGQKRGFTLIELLVVIAIIGILATIVLVGVNSVREKARDTRRLADLRQMRVIFEDYINTNGNVPGSSQGCYLSSNSSQWDGLASTLGATLPVDPKNGTNDYTYAFFRSNYVPGGCDGSPECGWIMFRRENDNYIVLMIFDKGGYSLSTVASSWWSGGAWSPNCGGDSYSGYVEY